MKTFRAERRYSIRYRVLDHGQTGSLIILAMYGVTAVTRHIQLYMVHEYAYKTYEYISKLANFIHRVTKRQCTQTSRLMEEVNAHACIHYA